nr:hypothetical protein Q903MT_gene779 [Picea sitchensis]
MPGLVSSEEFHQHLRAPLLILTLWLSYLPLLLNHLLRLKTGYCN